MDVYRFRSRARVVAIADLIISSMSLCLCLIFLIGLIFLSSSINIQDENKDDSEHVFEMSERARGALATFFLIVFIITTIATIIQILAAIKLLDATQLGKDPCSALKLCAFWRHVCIIFTVLLLTGLFFSPLDWNSGSIFKTIQILLRASAIYVVTKFMQELDKAITTGVLPTHCQSGTTPIIAGVYAYIPPNQAPQQYQPQPPYNPDMNAAPPSYHEVVKDPPPMKQ